MRHVVAVADVRHLQPLEILSLVLANRQEVGQRLARMEEIGQGIDDRNVGILGELLHLLMLEGADHHAVEIAREDASRILDRLAAPDLQVAVREEECLPAKLKHARLKGNARPRRGFLEDHAERLARENAVLYARLLHRLEFFGKSENRLDLLNGKIVNGK